MKREPQGMRSMIRIIRGRGAFRARADVSHIGRLQIVCLIVVLVLARSGNADRRTPLQMRVDTAISAALKRLARDQHPAGAWVTQDNRESTAATSLALMAFLAAGHVPGEGPYGERLSRGVAWVIGQQKPNGLLVSRNSRGPMYSHGIAALMLGVLSCDHCSRSVGVTVVPIPGVARPAC